MSSPNQDAPFFTAVRDGAPPEQLAREYRQRQHGKIEVGTGWGDRFLVRFASDPEIAEALEAAFLAGWEARGDR